MLEKNNEKDNFIEYEDIEKINIKKNNYTGKVRIELEEEEIIHILPPKSEEDKRILEKLASTIEEIVEAYSGVEKINIRLLGNDLIDDVKITLHIKTI